MEESKREQYLNKLRKVAGEGDAFKRIVQSEEWQLYIQPQIDFMIERAKEKAYSDEFIEDHEKYKNQAIEYKALKKLILLFHKPQEHAKKAIEELTRYGK
jgi:hypothetical protein